MAVPPSTHSMEGGNQLFNGSDRQNRGSWARCVGKACAGNRNEGEPARENLDLAMTDVSQQDSRTREREGPAVERMAGIRNRDPTRAILRH